MGNQGSYPTEEETTNTEAKEEEQQEDVKFHECECGSGFRNPVGGLSF
jgi:hypothetical protein